MVSVVADAVGTCVVVSRKLTKLRDALSPQDEDFVHVAFAQPASHLKLERSFSHYSKDLIFRCFRALNCEIEIKSRVHVLCIEH